MELVAAVRRYLMWRVIDIGLRDNAPSSIPTSGKEGRNNDCFAVYLVARDGGMPFLANELRASDLAGKWSEDDKTFTREGVLAYSDLAAYKVYIQHYYRGWVFYSNGVPSFWWKYLGSYPFLRVVFDRLLQFRFNRRELTRRDRMKVLEYTLQETTKKRDYEAINTQLLSQFYSTRWVHRPDKDDLMSYYSLLLDSLLESGDLGKGKYGYIIKPKALNTITEFQKEERRHSQNYTVQRWLMVLTVVLVFVGLGQIAVGGIQAWIAYLALLKQ